MDDDGSKRLSEEEFKKGIEDSGLENLTGAQIKDLFARFDKDGSGSVDYEEFLRAVRVNVYCLLLETLLISAAQ